MTREELQRLIDIIVAEMAAATGRPRTLCACHSVVDDCCPDRLRGVLDAGATRVGLLATGGAPASLASMIEHTLIRQGANRTQIEGRCRWAEQFKFAIVLVSTT